jgi:hypothetical protein
MKRVEEENGGWCSPIRKLYNKLRRTPDYLAAKWVKLMKPPFMHNQIAFLHSDMGQPGKKETLCTYNLTYGKLWKADHNYNSNLFGFVKVYTSKEKLQKLIKILEYFEKNQAEIPNTISFWKMSFIPQILRWTCCMRPLPKPTSKTKHWTCSEFTCYVLQKAGIIPTTIHPTYVDTTELYLILRGLPNVDCNAISPIRYPANSSVVPSETSADFVYSHNMPKRKKIPSYDSNSAFSTRVLQ